ncbi:MAG: chemotaxis protein CheA [Bacteroidales bacterium]|nr:chemotaxis protein CheA [Bacteroidales bacterium]
MQDLINSFLDEAADLLGDLEDSLLTLEENPTDKDAVHRVFRVMHTLKGSGGMFGFSAVSNFTHHLESIYFKIRNEELELSNQIFSLTLKSVDLIKELLKSTGKLAPSVQANYDALVKEIKAVSDVKEPLPDLSQENSELQEINKKANFNTYYIHFEPNTEILQNGTNPLYLVDELVALGDSKVILYTDNIPQTKDIQLENCYVSWAIILATKAEIGDIMDVFIFVEDDSQIDIINLSPYNLLQFPEFIKAIQSFENQSISPNINELQALGEQLVAKSQWAENETKNEDSAKLATEKANKEAKNSLNESKINGDKPDIPDIVKKTKTAISTFSTIRVSSKKIETLMNLVSEMVTSQAQLNLIAENEQIPELSEAVENLEKLTRELRDNAFEISLIPIETMLTRFKRLIRDLSTELKKDINFTAVGADTELDKTIIENLSDPLLHLFRNAIDHGIEDKATRLKKGKPEVGTITLSAFYSGTNVLIQISDDGAGIDPDIIRKKAIEKGIINANDLLSRSEIINLITKPGFSTSESVTDISGRGVGMDVVKKNIQKIQGELQIESTLGAGTTFTLKLPLTLSIIDGLIVYIEETPYIIPIPLIDKIRPITHSAIEKAFNNTLIVDNEQLPFIYLRQHFGITSVAPENELLIVVNYGIKNMAIVIDRMEKQTQVVVKSMGKHFQHQDIISGVSIMGDGKIALVLDTNKIINSIDKSAHIVK